MMKSAVLIGLLLAQLAAAQVPPTATKTFTPNVVTIGGTTTLTLTLTNPNPATTLTNLSISDTLPLATFQFVGFAGQTCNVGSYNPASGLFTVNQASLAPGASCNLSITIRALIGGTILNTTSAITTGQEGLTGNAVSATLTVGTNATFDSPFQVSYAANTTAGESFINITNDGANGAPLLGPGFGGAVGNICVNVYAFSPDEQLISCCSCLVTPNGLVNLGVNRDLTAKTLTGVIPTSVVVKALATLAGANGSGTSCTNSAATATMTAAVPGMLAWQTTNHNGGAALPAFRVTETALRPATLSAGELASITGRCASILGNGSGFGICQSCRAGALGANAF